MIPQLKLKRLPETATKYIFITDIAWGRKTNAAMPETITVIATLAQLRKIMNNWEIINEIIGDKLGCVVVDFSADVLNRSTEDKSDLVIDIRN